MQRHPDIELETSFSPGHMRRHAQPLLALGVTGIRTFSVCLGGGSIFRIAISTLPFLLPLKFQLAFGLSAFDAGLLVLAVFAGNLAMKPFTTGVMQRWGFRPVLMAMRKIEPPPRHTRKVRIPVTPRANKGCACRRICPGENEVSSSMSGWRCISSYVR